MHHGKQALLFGGGICMGREGTGGTLFFPPDALYIAGVRESSACATDLIEASIGGLVHDTD
jgi:hypothetical protein